MAAHRLLALAPGWQPWQAEPERNRRLRKGLFLKKTQKRQGEAPAEQSPGSRAAILSAALQSFARDGFDGASLPKIARLAEVAPPLIHYYFGSKENLWRETVDFSLGSLLRETTTIRNATASLAPLDRLRVLLEAFTLFAARFPDHFSMIIAEARSDSDRFTWLNENYTSHLFGFVTDALKDAKASGAVRVLNVEDLATMVVGAIFTRFSVGWHHKPVDEASRVAENYIAELFDVFLNGIIVR